VPPLFFACPTLYYFGFSIYVFFGGRKFGLDCPGHFWCFRMNRDDVIARMFLAFISFGIGFISLSLFVLSSMFVFFLFECLWNIREQAKKEAAPNCLDIPQISKVAKKVVKSGLDSVV
jgi:hypothetical protein